MEVFQKKFKTDIEFIKNLLLQNGPNVDQYEAIAEWYNKIGLQLKTGEINSDDVNKLRDCFEETYATNKALQGFVYTKPHGYHGDFEIIDKIYNKYVSTDEKFQKWDTWFHSLAATKAVRNRKEYFKKLLIDKTKNAKLNVLNLASGPCRGIAEFFETNKEADVNFDCIEIDPNAVKFATKLLQSNINKVNFTLANIVKYTTDKKYDLIWSAGLFDYFDNKTFVWLLNRYYQNLNESGELIIGNFHPSNASRTTMEFGLWYLYHRSNNELIELANKAEIHTNKISIEEESEGVNLFMRIVK